MAEIRVTGVALVQGVEESATGLLARFSCDLGPVTIRGCMLIAEPDGRVVVYLPRCKSGGSAIRFAERGVRETLTAAAKGAFLALGGVLPAP